MTRPSHRQREVGAPRAGEIGHGTIRARAYEIYLRRVRDGHAGDARSDWLQAERELYEHRAAPAARDVALLKGDQE